MICFDTQILIWGVQGTSHPDQASMIERTRRYIAHLEQAKEQVMIPALVLTEYLVGFEPADHERQLASLEKYFIIPSFDAVAAALTARILAQRDIVRGIANDANLRRRELTVDAMVIAIATVQQADALITEDDHFRSLAAAAGTSSLRVHGVPDRPVQPNLFGQVPEN